jgi:hypothetical protein
MRLKKSKFSTKHEIVDKKGSDFDYRDFENVKKAIRINVINTYKEDEKKKADEAREILLLESCGIDPRKKD